MGTKYSSECKSGHQQNNNIYAGKKLSSNPYYSLHLVDYHSLPQSHKELFPSLHDVPRMDNSKDAQNLAERDIQTYILSPCCIHGKEKLQGQCRIHKIIHQQFGGRLLCLSANLCLNENTQYQQPTPFTLDQLYIATHRKMGSLRQMQNLFFAKVQHSLKHHESNGDAILRNQYCDKL